MIRYIFCLYAISAFFILADDECRAQTHQSEPARRLLSIKKELSEFKPDPVFKEDDVALQAVRQALTSIEEGGFGIGALLVDEKTGKTVIMGHNELLLPYFRSDKHAEMVVMDKYEDGIKGRTPKTQGLTLYSSLEPCPMCTIRLLSANIKKVRYVSPDIDGGFVRRMNELPPYWKNQTLDKDYGELQCSSQLKKIAFELLTLSLELYGDRLAAS